jgi:hypothetical protein
MGLTATFGLMADTLLSKSAAVLGAHFHKSVVCSVLPFAFQVGDLDSGIGNDLWFLAIAVVVVAGILYVYRGPRHM